MGEVALTERVVFTSRRESRLLRKGRRITNPSSRCVTPTGSSTNSTAPSGVSTSSREPRPRRVHRPRTSAFTDRPKHLDPVQSYSEDEATFLYQIVEPPLQYHYLKRPYVLEPATSDGMPRLRRLDANGRELPATADPAKVVSTVVEVRIRPGILYQPHPAFATKIGRASCRERV